jgi:AcrR family transcriptional regulator
MSDTSEAKSNESNAIKTKGNSYHHGDLKTSLISAARTILQRDGADALSLRSIAAEVGVSHMAPYSHFKNKKELIQAITADGFRSLAVAMEQDSEGLTKPEELILAYGTAYLEFAVNNPQLYRIMLGQVDSQGRRNRKDTPNQSFEPKLSIEQEGFTEGPYALLRNAFARVYKDESMVKAQAIGAWSIVHGMAALIIEGHIDVPQGTSLKQFLAKAALRASPNIELL